MSDFDAGARLRELRTAAGMSQRQLAEASGVPHGQISMSAARRSSPARASLPNLRGGLSVSMSEFFEPDLTQSPQPFFTPAELRDLTSRLCNPQILHERNEPGADTGETMLAHHGSKGGIVIAGEVELTVGDQSRVLKAGDSYLFASNQPHRFRNIPDREAVVVSACTPPYL